MILFSYRTSFSTFTRRMSSVVFDNFVSNGVRGMKKLEQEKFKQTVSVPVLQVKECDIAKLIKFTKPYLLKLENFKAIQNLDISTSQKYIHMSPTKVKSWLDIAEEHRTLLEAVGISEKDFSHRDIEVTYDNLKYDQIFKAVLPENEEIVSGFSQIGHIIHLNLREHLLDYRPLIGQVLVDKVKTCRTVVNKNNIIDNTYRNFSMELIGGEEDYLVTVKENNCIFKFDFSKVYWNPRLCKEHERILNILNSGDVLFDVFCGVGPFAVPAAAKKKCKVFANDLNPESFKWLNHNAKTNKTGALLKTYNLDGKDFIVNVFKQYLIDYCEGIETMPANAKICVTMNLPAMAVEFLKYFKGLLKDSVLYDKLTCDLTVFVYCFVIGEHESTVKQGAIDLVNENIGYDVTDNIVEVFNVRNVSPKKEMMRVALKLTRGILFNEDDVEPPHKKICLDSSK